MSQPGVKYRRTWCLAIALGLIGAGYREVRAQANSGRSPASLPSTITGALVDPSSPPPLTSNARESRTQAGDVPPVFLDPRSLKESSTRGMGFQPSPSPDTRPGMLGRPVDVQHSPEIPEQPFQPPELYQAPMQPPIGFTGPSGVMPTEDQESSHFVPIDDRWRIGYPDWDRYGNKHPFLDDYPYLAGRWFDAYNQNVFKGDYPIIGQHTFLEITSQANLDFEGRQVPTQTSAFESTERPGSGNFFGRPNSFITLDFFSFSLDLFHGTGAFKPVDWRIKLVPTLGISNFSFSELAQTSPNVLQGTTRTREFWALQEAFIEYKLADLGPDYDFVSIRAGTQPFNADFRGFLFSDINRAVRIFGTLFSNRDQFNLAYFRQWEKDTNTALNTFNDRGQNLFFANYYRQDFLVPGYTAQVSLNYDNDPASIKYDNNRFLVRPDPVGNFQPHSVNVGYFGWAGDGHWGRYNLTHQFYWAFGHDSMNPLANRPQTINAQMAAIEGSYDRDWVRYRLSFFYASGDGNVNGSQATGFDTILDQPNFAGGGFSYWNRQQIALQGVNLTQRLSLVPDLRSSKIQGQANFVNPGLLLPTFGMDFELTPKLKLINNYNLIWFDKTSVLQTFLFQGNINSFVGFDIGLGCEYRPLVSENVLFIGGVQMLIPGAGFRDIYNNFNSEVGSLVAGFINAIFTF
jgi:hypothetical protein